MDEMSRETELLAADLAAAGVRITLASTQVVAKGALNMKNDWRTRTSGLPHAPYYPASITYDLTSTLERVAAEVGPDKDKLQGALGNILEFGTSKNPPRGDGAAALAAEEPRFYAAAADAAADAVFG